MKDEAVVSVSGEPPKQGEASLRNQSGWNFAAAFREERFFLMLSVFIGVFAGLAVVCFRIAIEWSSIALLGATPTTGSLRLIFIPVVASLVVAVLVMHVFPAARGSGVNLSPRAA